MTRSEVQVPHRPPKKKYPARGTFSLVDAVLKPPTEPRERGGEKRLGRFARELAGQAVLAARNSGAAERGRVPHRQVLDKLTHVESKLIY